MQDVQLLGLAAISDSRAVARRLLGRPRAGRAQVAAAGAARRAPPCNAVPQPFSTRGHALVVVAARQNEAPSSLSGSIPPAAARQRVYPGRYDDG